MTKKEYERAWKNLDKALNTIERLEEEGLIKDEDGYIFSEIVGFKNIVEEEIHKRTRSRKFEG